MNRQLKEVLDTLLLNIEVLNGELSRLSRSDQFTAGSLDLMEDIRAAAMCSLENVHTIERALARRNIQPQPADERHPF